jgi:hypothetical protein
MSQAASQLAPKERLRVAVHAADSPRRVALGRVVAEAGHIVVGIGDAADVVLADGGGPPGETRPVVTLGGADEVRSMRRYARWPPGWWSACQVRGKGKRALARCARLRLTRF